MDRLSPLPVIAGHWKCLADRRQDPPTPDNATRLISSLALIGPTVAGLALIPGPLPGEVTAALLAGAALLMGGLVAAFSVLAAWRTTLEQQADRYPTAQAGLRSLVDETVAHLLLATLWSALLVPISLLELLTDGLAARLLAAAAIGLTSHTVFLFWLTVPNLYSAYGQISNIDQTVDGFTSRR